VCILAGGGEFGEVYKAKWHGSYVAAKVLKRSDEIALGDFRTEIAILRKIHHPNCVQVRGGLWHSCARTHVCTASESRV
jgi:serine/threonine protein kinase